MKKETCRLCKSKNLVEFLDLGFHPHSDNFRKDKDLPEVTYPLTLNQCQDCQFVQLGYTVAPEVLYDEDYLYESSITKTADKHWTDFVDKVVEKTGITEGRMLDIGGNDGTLALKFKEKGFLAMNIDPCKQLCDISESRGIPTIHGLFPQDISSTGKMFNLITGSNVFAHIDDLHAVIEKVKELLTDEGVFVFESPYLGDFIELLEYDTVYHQHLSYLAVKPLITFLNKFDMEIFDIDFTPIHGGCFRCYIARKGQKEVQSIVKPTADNENFNLETLKEFAKDVERNRLQLMSMILHHKFRNEKIVGISSPAKGMTLLNYTGLGKYLDFVTDISKLKQERYTPGSHLLIKSDNDLQGDEVGLLLAWNFKDEIIQNVPQIKKWIIPGREPRNVMVYEK